MSPKATPKADALMYLGLAVTLAAKPEITPLDRLQLKSALELAVENVTAIEELKYKRPVRRAVETPRA